jgi:hypothetical protein
MAYQVHFLKLSFQRTEPDNPMVAVGEPEIVGRGGLVPDYVSTFIVSALLNAGMVFPAPDAGIPVEPIPVQPRTQDQPDVLPTPAVPPMRIGDEPTTVTEPDPEPETEPIGRPEQGDRKATWEQYAVQIGVPQGDAESMTKAALIAEVDRREALGI